MRFSKHLAFVTFVGALALPALAFAAETTSTASVTAEFVSIGGGLRVIGAGLAIGLSALGAGMAQGRIGSAGQGVLAERPEERIWVITLTALPEIIVLLGFVAAILLTTA